MGTTSPEPRFTWADLEQWADHGLIRFDQVTAIRAHVAGESGPTPPAGHPRATDISDRLVSKESRAGLNLVTIAYYFGAFMILLAYTFFLGLQWDELGRAGQAVAACGTVAGLWLIGRLLHEAEYRERLDDERYEREWDEIHSRIMGGLEEEIAASKSEAAP